MKNIFIILITFFLSTNLYSQIEVYETDVYSIEYPANWKLNTSVQGAIFAVTSPLVTKEDKFSENVNLIIQDLSGMNIDLDKYVSLSKKQLLLIPKGEVSESKRMKNGNYEYHKIVFKGFLENRNLKGKQIYIIRNEKAYVLTYTGIGDDYKRYVKYANEILNSFKLKN
jgi:serine/threonine-protein kinase